MTRAAKPKFDPTRKDWSLITKSYGGTVSILRNLTLREATELRERLNPFQTSYGPCADAGISYVAAGMSRTLRNDDGDLEEFIILGPEGWKP